ncbi:MAG: HigA family addiction module antidote protein [Proteobacteria bacterium]|nr:HigA family addiction module antidote protein [Pseudomonadota bacterium]
MSTLRSKQRRPIHPGAILREDVLPELKITQTEFADRLGVSCLSVSELIHERRSLSPEMAVRLATFLGTTPESWLQMQMAVSVWDAEQAPGVVESVRPMIPIKRRILRRPICRADAVLRQSRKGKDVEKAGR